MDEAINNNAPLSVIATTSNRLSDLIIKNGQLIFIQDECKIAFDFNYKRVFYNRIIELATDDERTSVSSPSNGYYFVISTAILWRYQDGWVQLTKPPDEIIHIGVELPELGQARENTLYVDKSKKEIAIYDSASNTYVTVADKTDADDIDSITEDEINLLF